MIRFVILVIVLVASSLSAEDSNINSKLKLGFIVPLSGPLAFFGKDIQQAVDLVIEADPSIAKNIEILWEDSQYDSKQAVSVFNKLVNLDRVDIIYSFGGPMLSALAPLAETKEVPFFATESEIKDCEGRKYCSLFRNSADEWGQAFWQVAREKNYKNIGIVKNENQFMNTFVDGIIRTKNSEEEVNVLINALPDASDFRTEVLKLKKQKLDALAAYLLPTSHKGFLNALKMNKLKFNLFGVEEFLVEENNKGNEAQIESAFVLAPAMSKNFATLFEDRFGFSAGMYYAVAGYDFVTLLNEQVKDNRSLRKLDLIKALQFQGYKIGQAGKYSVKKADNGVVYYSFPISAYEVHNGKGRVIKDISF